MGSDQKGRRLNNNRSNDRNPHLSWGSRYQSPAHPYEQVQGTAKGPGGEEYRAHVEDMGGKYRVGVYLGNTTVSEGSVHATEKRARRAAAGAVKKHASGNS